MENHVTNLDITMPLEATPRQQLLDVLERYLADLEQGNAPDQQALLAAHPELADELRPYLESLRLIDCATRDLRITKAGTSGEPNGHVAPTLRQIGEYQIVREIGRGGMGIVYEAHQKSLNRQVALKILPFAAVLDQRQIARFRNEAQAAAQLHHPHIVPVFAVGQEQGVYFYAMQFIDGQALDQAIAELRDSATQPAANSTKARGTTNGSTTTLHSGIASAFCDHKAIRHPDFFRTVARLGKEAADALHHAHEHGIVHRDVKPSNLLIDGRGKLWVTDFGLARIQSNNGVTLTGDIIGTLRYMSPEQASGSAIIDARSDVYSLGLTLYELLTQKHAHAGDDRQTLVRQIVDDDPIAPRKLNPAIPIDLETIVLGAMSKSRDDRYQSAQSLADDLQRFLEGMPTLCKRPSLLDRAGKWARRHRSLVATAACAIVLLSIVSVAGVVMLAREQGRTERNAKLSQHNFERAERHFQQAWAAVDQFGGLSDRLSEFPGAESVRRDALIGMLKYYREFALDAGNDPQLREESAMAHFRVAAIAAKLGAVQDAIQEYRTSQELLKSLIDSNPSRPELLAQLAVSQNNLGLLFASRAEANAARHEYLAAIAIQQTLVRDHSDNDAFASQLAESEANFGLLLDQLGDAEGAEQSLHAAVDVLRRLSTSQPQKAQSLAIALNNLGFMLRSRNPAAAEKSAREAIDILEHLATKPNTADAVQDDLALCYSNHAALKSQKGDWNEAVASYERAIKLQEQMVRKSSSVVRHRSELAISLNNLGVAYCRIARSAEADAAFARARDLFTDLAKDYPDETVYCSSLAAQLNNQALAFAGMGRHAEANRIYPSAIDAQKTCHERLPQSALMRELLSKMYYNFGQSLRAEKHWQEAAETALARRELWKGNGERLLGVAAELAELDCDVKLQKSDNGGKLPASYIDQDVLTTLQQAFESGWPRTIDVSADERFACFKQNARFATKIAELNERSRRTGAAHPTGRQISPERAN